MKNIKEILADNIIGTLATVDRDGSPWSTPLHIFTDDEALYWFSKEQTQHSRNIANNPQVCLALWSKSEGTKGAYISGKVEVVDEGPLLEIVTATLGSVPPVFENTQAYKLPLGSLDEARSSEKRWYFYT